MEDRRPLAKVALGLVALAIMAAAATALAGTVLANLYEPKFTLPQVGQVPRAVRRSDAWRDWHLWVSVAWLIGAAPACVAVGWLVRQTRGRVGREGLLVCGLVASSVMALGTILTRAAVAWDQLVVLAILRGGRPSGYWFAAFNDDVVFILRGGGRLSQDKYVPVLLAHLGAPVIGVAAGVVAVVALLDVTRPAPATPSEDSGDATTTADAQPSAAFEYLAD